MPLLKNVIHTNEGQKGIIVDKILQHHGDIKGKRMALLGLSFKLNTDDLREASDIAVILTEWKEIKDYPL